MSVTGVSMARISAGRRVAFRVLEAVGKGAYASDTLRDWSLDLDGRDAGLAAQIVFGSLRYQGQLDYLISLYSGRRVDQLDLSVAVALRAAIFQLRYLERVPSHAAVNESVEWVKERKRAAAGLANAVLRKVNRRRVDWPDLETQLSCPKWLLEHWTDHFGSEQAREIAEAALEEPVAYVRGTRFHDIGAQSIIPLLDLQPNHAYLDLCAAPGNKTLQALEIPLSLALACDISPKRIRDIPSICPRIVLDASQPLPFSRQFDRILVDAPCSGTGTLGRNPEIKWRVQERDLARFAQMQRQIVVEALKVMAPGGKLVYATCSLEREENEKVVASVLESGPGLRCEREVWRLPGRDEGDGFYAAVLSENVLA